MNFLLKSVHDRLLSEELIDIWQELHHNKGDTEYDVSYI